MSDPASSCDVPDRPNNEAGFTLPEIIAALLILALSLGGIFGRSDEVEPFVVGIDPNDFDHIESPGRQQPWLLPVW